MFYDVALVGGGIVGLATARELLLRHPRLKLIVLEKDEVLAAQQTGHNSGVIHSGVYYRPGSLKARLCLEGRASLWKYCDANGIAYRNVGKLIVATEERELAALDRLYARGLANGIAELRMLDAGGIAQREPHCRGIRAIHSPLTGIVDFARVARSFARDVLRAGGTIETATRCRFHPEDRERDNTAYGPRRSRSEVRRHLRRFARGSFGENDGRTGGSENRALSGKLSRSGARKASI